MKKLIYISRLLLCCLLFFTSCSKDLEVKPLGEISEAYVWSDPKLTEAFINYIYYNFDIGDLRAMGERYAALIDECHQWFQWDEFNNGLITPDVLPNWGSTWSYHYQNIRNCNLFFENVDKIKFDNTLTDGKTLKDRMSGEVHFLRAHNYHMLVSLFGGVPIIKNAYDLTDDFKAKRDTYKDCIQFIVDECDQAASMLPEVQTGANKGRATKGAALALKARTLLYAASDLHNTTVFPGFSNPELIGYTDANRTARWQAAKDAAKAVIDLGIYSLYKATPAPGDSVAKNIKGYFISRNMESEDIFMASYLALSKRNNTALSSGPNGWHCYGHNTPISELVDDYEMKNGTSFSWLNPAQAAAPYKNRDPRFYSTILYEGAYWKPRPADITGLDPVGVIQVGSWETWDAQNNKMVEIFGLDTRKGVVDNWNGGYTGYYNHKTLDPAENGQFYGSSVPWRFFRYGEVLLNYAEACIELGQDAEARTYINMIRTRAGMPDITESGTALRDRYRHERRIEFAIEHQRFYDVRRWVLGTQKLNSPVHGIQLVYKLNPDKTTSTVPTITHYAVQTRKWLDKAYFLPILRSEMNKNDLLIQNPGY